ncbi:hypothetical protein DUNSADRAFT_4332 [Dunaliella salina]|uniref:Arrestin C-terminal-like domain-containing protein n=1 Tax=Dunaliella salina TaxID=3046 RepID=A0ABQ7H7N9_DUNSA|nr:hypothetical protein DUNSADRAFT_4332 [Dunaliella salina]|eukprot:KAF5842873.1 hypothetical protein DUNSADRAFT_4332 [Dunaliella salina]
MGQYASVHVQLESDRYYPGQTVRGTAHMHATEATDTGGIFLKAIGEMRTKWRESYGQTGAQYVGKEQVMKGEQMLAGSGTIKPGYHSYPFDFSLPATAPASFDFNNGDKDGANQRYQSNGFKARASISYFVEVVCKKEGTKSRDVKPEPLPFTVLGVVADKPSGPFSVFDSLPSKVCWFISSGILSGKLTLSTSSAAPGSNISFTAELDNDSSGTIQYVQVNAKQRVTLRGGALSKKAGHHNTFTGYLTKEKTKLSQDQLKPGGRVRDFAGNRVVPPSTLPTFSSNLIQIEHYMELLAKMGPLTQSFRLEAPLFVSNSTEQPFLPYPYIAPHGGSKAKAVDPEKAGMMPVCYTHPKLEAPHDWSPVIYQPATFTVLSGPPDSCSDDADADAFFKAKGW